MAKKKLRKTLPKELAVLMTDAKATSDYTQVHAALEACEPYAYGGSGKGTALHFPECTPQLAEWLLARGIDVNAEDTYGKTPLHRSAFARFHHSLPPLALIQLGADVRHPAKDGLTPLHYAADGKNLPSVQTLLEHGADSCALSDRSLTPLDYALVRMTNIDLAAMVPVARALLDAGDKVTPSKQESVAKAAKTFEFHRAAFAKDKVEEASAGISALCELFDVAPVGERKVHDGSSLIVATKDTWQAKHQELWELLVPSQGACQTVQGEVIRITGRIADELHRNGGVNWGRNYPKMAAALVEHLGSHSALDGAALAEAAELVAKVRDEPDGTTERLMELAVQWVAQNQEPQPLLPPEYGNG